MSLLSQLVDRVTLLENLLQEVLASTDNAQLQGYNGDLVEKIEAALEE